MQYISLHFFSELAIPASAIWWHPSSNPERHVNEIELPDDALRQDSILTCFVIERRIWTWNDSGFVDCSSLVAFSNENDCENGFLLQDSLIVI